MEALLGAASVITTSDEKRPVNDSGRYTFPPLFKLNDQGAEYMLCWGRLYISDISIWGPEANLVNHCVLGEQCSFSLNGTENAPAFTTFPNPSYVTLAPLSVDRTSLGWKAKEALATTGKYDLLWSCKDLL